MATRINTWTNSRIIIKDPHSDKVIIDTDIQDCDYASGWIWVQAPDIPFEIGEKIHALIISQDSLEECQCTVRSISNRTDLQLTVFHRNNLQNSREHQRYTVSLPGIVRNIWENGQPTKKTANVFSITIINMSSSGILFQTPKRQFAVDDTFDIIAKMDNRQLLISGVVVRIQNTQDDGLNEECAAKILSIKYT